MRRFVCLFVAFSLSSTWGFVAFAQGTDVTPKPPTPATTTTMTAAAATTTPTTAPITPGAETTSNEELLRRIEELEKQNEELREDLDTLKDDHKYDSERIDGLMPLKSKISGYVDFGFFAVTGDGSGIRNDTGYRYFPQYDGVVPDSWVFMGDPLSTAINSRGDPADTSGSRAIAFDPVHNKGKPSFILNSLTMSLFQGIGNDVTLNSTFDLVARGRDVSDAAGHFVGDYVDLRLAYAEYRVPIENVGLSLYAGKFDSVVGIEYRTQEAPDRISVTPSLICRYTCGHPLGLKARLKLFEEKLIFNVAVTNGSNFIETFPFNNEIDRNKGKTGSARLSYKFPLGKGLEIGASGAYGAQDQQESNSIYQWHYGFDLRFEIADLDLRAEFVQGKAPGKTEPGEAHCGLTPCLQYKGAYGQLGYRLTNWLMPYGRVDWRDALHENGASFVYISKLMRYTAGARFELGTSVIVKAEYTWNRELGGIPQFPNDVFTSSLVVKF
jgi:opacity protein-like surface antigen